MPPLSTSLAQLLRDRRAAALVADAELIRDWHNADERLQQARQHVRLALGLRAMSRPTHDGTVVAGIEHITDDELHRIYSILDFAIEGSFR